MTKKDRYSFFISYFKIHQPNPETELQYTNAYELLVAVILSAQCTDKRVNQTTPAFFSKFPNVAALAVASQDEVFDAIKSISYPNNKAKNLIGMAEKVQSDFGGVIPERHPSLLSLPGVGRKTANVITSVFFNLPAMAVDTHVFRVANRIGLTKAKTPLESEKQLVKHISRENLSKAHHWLILHGRYICKARTPLCSECGLTSICKFFQEKFRKNTEHPTASDTES